jgi:hypothetical protein
MSHLVRLSTAWVAFFSIAAALVAVPGLAASDQAPRVIARFDVGLLGNAGGGAKGGGITVPTDGTGAGLEDAGGVEVGAELRLWRWISLDAGAGRYQPTILVARDQGDDVMVDTRSASVDLQTLELGLVITPPKWRTDKIRGAIGLLVSRAEVTGLPEQLGLSIDEADTGFGVDFRGDFLLSRNRHWGVGMALAFVSFGPEFTDLETGYTGSLQTSGLFLRFGARGAW